MPLRLGSGTFEVVHTPCFIPLLMERKYFLKSLLAGVVTAPALLAACGG